MNYLGLKKQALESQFSRANNMQKQAIFQVNGSVLIIAGAGSGKTTVLVNRIANMLRFGNAYHDKEERSVTAEQEKFLEDYPNMEKTPENAQKLADIIAVNPVNPWNILAITFTNKAAGELRERLITMIGEDAKKICAATFHSACVRILRREIEHLGYKREFTIYDDDDTKRLIKEIMKRHNLSERIIAPKVFKNAISSLKDRMISAAEYTEMAREHADMNEIRNAEVYTEYQKALETANAVDFDDIIFLTVRLFEEFPDVLEHYRNLYKYIMVDEYQDTNIAQYRLVSLLAGNSGNLAVVGDDDQSIYRFRGATVENILSFEKQYKDCTVIRLEQNYRSTENILNAANAVIKNNQNRKDKTLWSDLGAGDKIEVNYYQSEQSEGREITEIITEGIENGGKYSDYAILYRNNALSRGYETALTRAGIPYKIVGGVRFYDRKEIRDMMAYLTLVNNPYDTMRFRRVINEPKRSIGDVTVDEVIRIAEGLNISPIDVCRDAFQYETLTKRANALKAAANIFDELEEMADKVGLDELIDAAAEKSGYMEMLRVQGEDGKTRIENIEELKSNAVQMMNENPETTLEDFLEQVALVSDIDNYDSETDRVSLMTMHSAKGLEFPVVFMVAAEDNIFPSAACQYNPAEMEEERRLAYVAITRAKKRLVITHSRYRTLYGKTACNKLSAFVREIPQELCDKHGEEAKPVHAYSKPEPRSFFTEETATMNNTASAANTEDFAPGDKIKHKIFGEGTIEKVEPTGNDAMITINFVTRGMKVVMRNNSKMTKIQ